MESSFPNVSFTSGERTARLLFLRRALAASLVLTWVALGLPHVWPLWAAAAGTPSASLVPYDEQREKMDGGHLYPLWVTARRVCPPARDVLVFSDAPIVAQGLYHLYPVPLSIITSRDAYAPADLRARAGGCAITYNPDWEEGYAQRREWLEQYLPYLHEVECRQVACLYRVAGAEAAP